MIERYANTFSIGVDATNATRLFESRLSFLGNATQFHFNNKGDLPGELCSFVGQFVAGHGFGAAIGARVAFALCAAAATNEAFELLEERRC